MIIHKPSFSAAQTYERVPQYLVLAMCALAAPYHKELTPENKLHRLAGVPFFDKATELMFSAGNLRVEPTLPAAQALCLLEMHEIAASHSWTRSYRYFGKFRITKLPIASVLMQLRIIIRINWRMLNVATTIFSSTFPFLDVAMQVLEDALEVQRPHDPNLQPSLNDLEWRQYLIDRECTRRCFWLMQCMGWINGIYTYRPMRPRNVELMKIVPLPIDEDSFELGKLPNFGE